MINTSNYTGKDNPEGLDVQPGRPAATTGAPARATTGRRAVGGRLRHVVMVSVGVLPSWLAAITRRPGQKLFATSDIEACWRGWQITKLHGGLGRRYRDPRFDTLAACGRCRGAGVNGDEPCSRCQGAGRVIRGEVS